MALLHATAAAAASQGVHVVALHVHHGLHPEADAWLAHVQRLCGRWARRPWPLSFMARRLQTAPAAGDSIEAWARRERYRALTHMAGQAGTSLVLLAHHRSDQAETFLLQALRGAGPAGQAAMPREAVRGGITWARPWLDEPRRAIHAYVRRHRIAFVDDPGNADRHFARNRLRAEVMPALVGAFADAEHALALATRRAAEAQAALDEIAIDDLESMLDGDALRVRPWSALTPGRRRNALRAWVGRQQARGAAHSLIDRLLLELPGGASGQWPAWQGEIRLYRGLLRYVPATAMTTLPPSPLLHAGSTITFDGPGSCALPAWGGTLHAEAACRDGIALADLQACELRSRAGGERFQAGPDGTPRCLKRQFQTAGVPAWDRAGPLVFATDGRLLFVPALGTDARAAAPPGEPQLRLTWAPDARARAP